MLSVPYVPLDLETLMRLLKSYMGVKEWFNW
jgi:hypothetical protein